MTKNPMTVGRLRSLLKGLDADARVLVQGYEGGFEDVAYVTSGPIAIDAQNVSYEGPHLSVAEFEARGGDPGPGRLASVVVLDYERNLRDADQHRVLVDERLDVERFLDNVMGSR